MKHFLFLSSFILVVSSAQAEEDPWYKTAPSCVIDRGNPARTGYYDEAPLTKLHKIAWMSQKGFMQVPTCYQNKIFVWEGYDPKGGLVGLDTQTGAQVWNKMVPFYNLVIYRDALYVSTQKPYGFIAYDLKKNQILSTGPTGLIPGLIYNGIAYLTGHSKVVAYRLSDKKILWERNYPTYKLSTDGKNLYFQAQKELVALDLLSGATVWDFQYNADTPSDYLAISAGLIFLASYDHHNEISYLCAFDKNTGKPVWHIKYLQNPIYSSIVIAKNNLFVPTEKYLYSYDLKDKKINWRLPIESGLGGFSVAQNIAYMANDKFLYAVDVTKGKIISQLRLPFTDDPMKWGKVYVENIIPYQDTIFAVITKGNGSYLIAIR